MKKHLLAVTALFLTINSAFSAVKQNDCHLFDSVTTTNKSFPHSSDSSSKTEERFNEIISQVTSLYTSEFNRLNINFKVEKDFKDPTLNAFAKKDGRNWTVNFFGGLYKSSVVTDDGFALVICHEIGHLIGGAPFYYASSNSSEGQADFWATSVCMKKYAAEFQKTAGLKNARAKMRCDQHYNEFEEKNICYRTANAAESLATFFARANMTSRPDFDKNNYSKLNYTNDKHPEAQCRLDTYIAGSLCDREEVATETLIFNRDTADSLCNEVVDGAIKKVEKRPGCWFNEKVHVYGGNYKTIIKSHSMFGLKGGKVQLSFLPHEAGDYKAVMEVDSADGSNEYVQLKGNEFTSTLGPYSMAAEFPFAFSFLKKANRNITFNLKIYLNGSLYMQDKIVIKAYALR